MTIYTSAMAAFSGLKFRSRLLIVAILTLVSVVLYFSGRSTGRKENFLGRSGGHLRSVTPVFLSPGKLVDDRQCNPTQVSSDEKHHKTLTDLTEWGFQTRVVCPNIDIDGHPSTRRRKVTLVCTGSTPHLDVTWTNSSGDIDTRAFNDTCLSAYIDHCCMDGRNVPNVVHYVWFNRQQVELISLVSFLSVVRFMHPCLVLFHGDHLPFGKHWDYFVSVFPYVLHVKRSRPTHIYGQRLSTSRHGGDVMRLQALLRYGGVYLDWDQVLLRPIDELRNHVFTMGLESPRALANGMILSVKNAMFLRLYMDGYKNYTGAWNYNSIQYPYILSLGHPKLIHVAGYKFFKPFYSMHTLYYNKNYNWSESYAMHFYYIRGKLREYSTVRSIRSANTTIGSVWRHILFGNKELCIET